MCYRFVLVGVWVVGLMIPMTTVAASEPQTEPAEQLQERPADETEDDEPSDAESETSERSESVGDPAWDNSLILRQALVAGGTAYTVSIVGMTIGVTAMAIWLAGATIDIIFGREPTTQMHPAVGIGFGIAALGPPIVAPLGVNVVGASSGYGTHWLGSILGATGAAAGSVGLLAVLSEIEADELSGVLGLLYPMIVTAGGIVGYHLQAGRSDDTSRQQASMLRAAPLLNIDESRDETTMGLGLQGRF